MNGKFNSFALRKQNGIANSRIFRTDSKDPCKHCPVRSVTDSRFCKRTIERYISGFDMFVADQTMRNQTYANSASCM